MATSPIFSKVTGALGEAVTVIDLGSLEEGRAGGGELALEALVADHVQHERHRRRQLVDHLIAGRPLQFLLGLHLEGAVDDAGIVEAQD